MDLFSSRLLIQANPFDESSQRSEAKNKSENFSILFSLLIRLDQQTKQ